MGRHILVADDDPTITEVVSLLLSDEGYRVTTTTDGESVKNISHNPPDLILLDIWMSGIDGRDIVKFLKNQPQTQAIPIILFSANQDCEAIALECGAEDYLLKPFEINDLIVKVEQLLGASA